jgi:hypothetical protein
MVGRARRGHRALALPAVCGVPFLAGSGQDIPGRVSTVSFGSMTHRASRLGRQYGPVPSPGAGRHLRGGHIWVEVAAVDQLPGMSGLGLIEGVDEDHR